MKINSFWQWLLSEIEKYNYLEHDIQGICNVAADSLFVLESFKAFVSQVQREEPSKEYIYRDCVCIYMNDGGIFLYDWNQEYDGDVVYEKHITFIPPFITLYKLKGYSAQLTAVEYVFNNPTVPDHFTKVVSDEPKS